MVVVGACPGQPVGDQVPSPSWASVCVPVGVGTGCNGIWHRPVPWEQGGLPQEHAVGAAGCNTRLHWEWRRQLQPHMQLCGHGHCQPELG